MTQRIPVALKPNPYDILVGHDILASLPAHIKKLGVGRDAVIISHSVIERLHGAAVSAALKKAGYTVKFLNVPEGEKSKSAAFALSLIEQMAAYDVGRNIFVVALGGGVVGDLGGFVAAIYKRGIPYIQVPTTLLAQIDSAIGGKTAIDLKVGKNLVGAFYQPKLVYSDTKVLKTLSRRQLVNGLAEAIKYGVIADAKLFSFIESNYLKFFKGDAAVVNHIVKRCAQIKAQVVASDEKDTKGLRAILNFGHTIGHAIEAAAKYDQYQHGESVGLGMRCALHLSRAGGLLSAKEEIRINALITAVGLPTGIKGVSLTRILELMRHDKKFVAGENRFILAEAIGRVRIVANVPQGAIVTAIKSYTV